MGHFGDDVLSQSFDCCKNPISPTSCQELTKSNSSQVTERNHYNLHEPTNMGYGIKCNETKAKFSDFFMPSTEDLFLLLMTLSDP